MREIFFRAKRIDNSEWVYGGYAHIYSNPNTDIIVTGRMCFYEYGDELTMEARNIDPSTLGQYTGLTDKNGNKIFEGDIVFYWCSDVTAVVKYGQYIDTDSSKQATGFYVEYLEDGKTVQENMDLRENDEEYGCEVIGNIYDNPELMKGD